MSIMLSLLSFPFEVEEAAQILQVRPEKIRLLLATGRLHASYAVRELLPTRTQLMTGWDLLEYMIKVRIRDLFPQTAPRLSNVLVDEFARCYDDGSQSYRELEHDEIWWIAEVALMDCADTDRTVTCDTFTSCGVLVDILQQSWCSLKAGLTNFHEHLPAVDVRSPWVRQEARCKSVFGLLRGHSFSIRST
jgi:hypothetical protein